MKTENEQNEIYIDHYPREEDQKQKPFLFVGCFVFFFLFLFSSHFGDSNQCSNLLSFNSSFVLVIIKDYTKYINVCRQIILANPNEYAPSEIMILLCIFYMEEPMPKEYFYEKTKKMRKICFICFYLFWEGNQKWEMKIKK